VKESLLRAQDLLTAMLAGNRAAEFAQEAVAYWRAIAGGRRIDCIVEAGDHPHPTHALFRDGQLHAVADDLETYRQSLADRSGGNLTSKNAVYLPLDPVAADPSFLPNKLLTIDNLRKYFRALPEQDRGMASLLPALQSQREVLLVLGLRRPHGERALLGVHLIEIQGDHPLERDASQATLQAIELVRRDRTFLAPRGGASIEFYKRRVLIAGCGAVGGYLALAMARAGVGALSLVDHDLFTLENTYRHACGMAYTGQRKALGLKSEIERAVPYISVTPYPMSVKAFLERHPSALQEHDLVLSVLGAPTTELDLNERVWSNARNPPALFSWLEPLGLGGHALLTHARGETGPARGCLECLYYRYVQGGALENHAAFAKQGVPYTRDTLGCGSRFLPFADLDAQRTGELAARLALQILQGRVAEFQLRSWKGDRRAFEEAGYSVTENYEVQPGSASYIRDDCPVCAAV
jgi:hypothetical protein